MYESSIADPLVKQALNPHLGLKTHPGVVELASDARREKWY